MSFLYQLIKIYSLSLLLNGVLTAAYADQPLPVEQAFQLTTQQMDAKTLSLHWTIQPGYFLYREKMHFACDWPIKSIFLPPGLSRQNKFFKKYQVYQKEVTVFLQFMRPVPDNLAFRVHYQGCAAAGFCYPPVTQLFTLPLQKTANIDPGALNDKQSRAVRLLASHNVGLILLSFFGFGLLLSLTPCVLPLIPILYAIILGRKTALTTWRAFNLSSVYVLAMASTYALAGVFAGLAGSYLQSFLQNPLIIISVSMLFVYLAFSLFGFYEVKLPVRWQEKLNLLVHRQQGGSFTGVALMGCLSSLIISPCVTAPLVGVLTYIANTGNAVLGGIALFILGLGSGVPLLIIGTSAGRWFPKAGAWVNRVKIVLGIIMLMMAAWLLLRVAPQNSPIPSFVKPNKPNAVTVQGTMKSIKGISDLEQALMTAKAANKPVLLDFFAQWCISCQEMEYSVLPKSQVKNLLSRFILLRADVSANDGFDKALEKKFNVVGPPAFLFFTPYGKELARERIVGSVDYQEFTKHLQETLSAKQHQ